MCRGSFHPSNLTFPLDFLWSLVALAHFMRLSLLKGARATSSCAAWQEIRVGDPGSQQKVPLQCSFFALAPLVKTL
jgi:hypothetical protein